MLHSSVDPLVEVYPELTPETVVLGRGTEDGRVDGVLLYVSYD